MRDVVGSLGVDADGRPFLVHATAAPEYGAGALIGLVAGATLEADGGFEEFTPTVVTLAQRLVESLMQCGMVKPADIAPRFAGGPVPGGEVILLLALPVALFHAGQPDELTAGVVAVGKLLGADARSTIAAVAVASAVSAGTFELANGYDMAVAAVLALDDAAAHVGVDPELAARAREELREDLRAAVSAKAAPAVGGRGAGTVSGALRCAFWHLLRADDAASAIAEVAAGRDLLASALTGLLLGAAHGAQAFPAAWRDALAPRTAPLMAILHTEP